MRPPLARHDVAAPALVPAVVRAAALMDTLARSRQPMSMARLASELQLPRSSVHGLCSTLVSLGFLRRAADGHLAIGPQVMRLAEAFVAGTDVAREFDVLWQAQGQPPEGTVLLSVLDGAEVMYLATRNSGRPLGLAFTVGMRLPSHLAATGKAMLAFSDAATVRQALAARPLARLTEHSTVDVGALQRELDATRERGLAIDDEGVRLGVCCVAAPVFDAAGHAVASLGLCQDKAMLDAGARERQSRWVRDTAQALSRRLGGVQAEAGAADSLSTTRRHGARSPA